MLVCFERDDPGEDVAALEGEVLDDEVPTGISVYHARDGHITKLCTVQVSGVVRRRGDTYREWECTWSTRDGTMLQT
jgi:ketosteroid isomerase-like protein